MKSEAFVAVQIVEGEAYRSTRMTKDLARGWAGRNGRVEPATPDELAQPSLRERLDGRDAGPEACAQDGRHHWVAYVNGRGCSRCGKREPSNG